MRQMVLSTALKESRRIFVSSYRVVPFASGTFSFLFSFRHRTLLPGGIPPNERGRALLQPPPTTPKRLSRSAATLYTLTHKPCSFRHFCASQASSFCGRFSCFCSFLYILPWDRSAPASAPGQLLQQSPNPGLFVAYDMDSTGDHRVKSCRLCRRGCGVEDLRDLAQSNPFGPQWDLEPAAWGITIDSGTEGDRHVGRKTVCS